MNSGGGWVRMRGLQYRRLCARPGCGAPAVTTLRFQPTLREAWLSDLDETSARSQGDLCHRHAEALVLPRGWELHEERTDHGRADAEEPRAEPVATEAPRPVLVEVPAPAPVAVAVESNGHASPEAVVEPEPVRDPVSSRVIPVQFGSNDDDDSEVDNEELSAMLDARTPLLQRAFRNAKPAE